jgi:hypothetical protein
VIGDQDVDAAPQRSGQRLVEVTNVDLATGGGLADEKLGAAAGYEDSGVHSYPQRPEVW